MNSSNAYSNFGFAASAIAHSLVDPTHLQGRDVTMWVACDEYEYVGLQYIVNNLSFNLNKSALVMLTAFSISSVLFLPSGSSNRR